MYNTYWSAFLKMKTAGAHLAARPQHVQVLQAVPGQVAQGPLSQQEVLVGLTDQREAQTLDPQPQSAHLLGEGVSRSQTQHATVGLLQGQRLLPGHRLHQQPARSLPGQRGSAADLPESQRIGGIFRHIETSSS